MGDEKLSSSEVPKKFVEWLLLMGCPPDKIPGSDKISQMCRGQFYMVWRSMMERVKPKEVVKETRLQVFCDDIQRCQKANSHDKTVLVPLEVQVWRQQQELKKRLEDAEQNKIQLKKQLDSAMAKVTGKLSHRATSRDRVASASRRASLRQNVARELVARRDDLAQTYSIAEELCRDYVEGGVAEKLETCLSLEIPNQNASTNTSQVREQTEEQLSILVKCSAPELWTEYCEQRSKLVDALTSANKCDTIIEDSDTLSPQSVVALTAGLHSYLALNAMKNKILIKDTQLRLETRILELKSILSNQICELHIQRCMKAAAEARLSACKTLLEELSTCSGVFRMMADQPSGGNVVSTRSILEVDRNILTKKEQIKQLLTSISRVEMKTQSVRENLLAIFHHFKMDADQDFTHSRLERSLVPTSIPRQFYQEWRKKRNPALSFVMDVSDGSLNSGGSSDPTLIDELKILIKRFNLDLNRSLVLPNGEKIWTFESLRASLERIFTSCTSEDVSCLFVCPSVCIADNMRRIVQKLQARDYLEHLIKRVDNNNITEFDYDTKHCKQTEDAKADKIKKLLNANVKNYESINTAINMSEENINLWCTNSLRTFVSNDRLVANWTYETYERLYVDAVNIHK